MNDTLPDDKLDANAIVEKAKVLRKSLSERRYFSAIKNAFILMSALYKQYLKGKYVSVQGKKIPAVAVIAAAMIAGYSILPAEDENAADRNNTPQQQETAEQAAQNPNINTYNKDGIQVYGLYKCDKAVCGYIENSNEKDFSRVLISITFHDEAGNVVYEGGVEAAGVIAMSRMKFTIPVDDEYSYFRLTDVTVER